MSTDDKNQLKVWAASVGVVVLGVWAGRLGIRLIDRAFQSD